MSRRAHWVVGAISIAVLLALPAAALAVFPGENGKIAFVSGIGGAANDDSSADVYILDGPGDNSPTPLTSTTGAVGQHRHPAWSPRLDAIAYARWESASNEKIFIDFLDVPGIAQLRLGPHESAVRDDRPAWNPAGTKIAYESEVTDGSGQMDIMVATIDEDGGNVSSFNLTDTPTITEGKPVWSADGKLIYYHTNLTADQDIYREASDGSQAIPTSIIGPAGGQFQPALSPGGSELCYTEGSFSNAADVFKRTVSSSGTPVEISDETVTVADYNCAWSPEGDKITYVTGLLTAGALVYKNSDDTGPVESVTSDTADHFDGNPDWAPKRAAFCQGKPATIAGTDAKDDLRGTNEKDVIQGHADKDSISARGGKDRACGRGGNDTLKGGKDDDKLFGAAGNDVLRGGPGRDTCEGGGGNDTEIGCER